MMKLVIILVILLVINFAAY
ncbi:type I toxin-antitoxin system Ibs family toxin [Pluralibacter gergoviae]|nr:type I toxin-antitoxin system Ibs family toxin [Pluralibacter gergoviae]